MLTTLQSENLQITRPSAPVPVSARGSGIAKRAPMSLCSQKFPKRCGIGRRYGCVDAEQPCGSRDSVSAQCNRSAVGPSRRDRGALKRCGRLELVHPAHDMPCASLNSKISQLRRHAATMAQKGDVMLESTMQFAPAFASAAQQKLAARP